MTADPNRRSPLLLIRSAEPVPGERRLDEKIDGYEWWRDIRQIRAEAQQRRQAREAGVQ
jgi:hypothetical protein